MVEERCIESRSQRWWFPYSFAITLSIHHIIYIDILKQKTCVLLNSYESSNSCLSFFDRLLWKDAFRGTYKTVLNVIW